MSLDVYLEDELGKELYSFNITHNLNTMAEKVGIYKHMWRPDELGFSRAGELVEGLKKGFDLLVGDPVYYMQFNPSNGWGDYAGLVNVLIGYIQACKTYPNACLYVSR